jgi:hypothetical protein
MNASRAFSDAGKLVASLLHNFDWFSNLCLCVFVNIFDQQYFRPGRHVFHASCAETWFWKTSKSACPYCRKVFTEFSMRVMRFDHLTFLHFRFNFLAFEEEDVDDGVGFDGNEQDI